MPIIIAGHVDFAPGRVEGALQAARPVIEAARGRPGYVAYTWALDPFEPGRVRVFAEWEDEASLAYHFAETYKQMGAVFGEVPGPIIRDVQVRKYQCGKVGAVHDEEGKPRLDFFDN